MQTTLLGLAIAIILALVAALVGPLLVDWGGYRSLFETQASRLIGLDVRVTGVIDARLLPSPRLTLHGIAIGGGEEGIRADSLGIEFALAPLLRGEWQASDMRLVGPRIRLGLDAAGQVQAPHLAFRFSPDALSIDHLSIEDGTLTLTDATNGARLSLDRLWFNGEAHSLLGPFKGEGAVTVGGDLYPFRIAAGRYGDDGRIKLHVNIDPVNRPLSVEADGMLALAGRKPDFDGNLSVTRPVGIASRGGVNLTQPWRLSGKVKASAASALMEQLEFQYGSEDQGFKLTGDADFKFGKHPRFDGVLSGRQIDLDRALSSGDGGRPAPGEAIRRIAELTGAAFRPSFPVQIGIGIDQVTLGGNAIANLRGDLAADSGGWNLQRFEFRAPGFTDVKLSGQLAVSDTGVSFNGPAEIKAGAPRLLAAWLQGRAAPASGRPTRPLNLRGVVTLASDKFAIEGLKAEFDGKTIAGRLVYAFAGSDHPTKLDAELNTPALDVDAALDFGKAILGGSDLERPNDMTIAAAIGRATMAGVAARDVNVRMKIDAGGLQIDRLSVADLGGGAVSASGRIDMRGHAPRGALALDFETHQTAAITALVVKFAPQVAGTLTGLLDRANHLKLHAALDVAGEAGSTASAATVARLTLNGDINAMRVDARASMSGDWEKPSAADLHVDATVDAPDGEAMIKMLGLDRIATAGKGDGQIKLSVNGHPDLDLNVEAKLSGGGLQAQGIGQGQISLDQGAHLTGTLDVPTADLAPLRPAGVGALPFTLTSRFSVSGRRVSFDDINARIAGSSVRGHIALDGASPRRIDGELEADAFDIAAAIARATDMPAAPPAGGVGWAWSSEPFGAGVFGNYAGAITLKARQVDLLPRLRAREFRATLHLGKRELALDDMSASLAGGHFAGRISLHAGEEGLNARAKISVNGADASALLPSSARPPIAGSLDLSGDVAGSGLSPVALIGSLQGAGKFTLSDGQFAGLDPHAFGAVTRAVDQGLPLDSARIGDLVSKMLDGGQLSVKHAGGTLAVSAGQVRVSHVSAESKDAKVSLAGTIDLTDGSIDARLLLSEAGDSTGSPPDIFMALRGPVSAPVRSIDVSALTGWLTLRAVENQAKRLHAIEGVPPTEKPPNTKPPRPKSERAPVLPAPIDIKPPVPPSRANPPEASVGSQN
ncbi:MAG TPA: AsmA family protein [Pseudolabrys sp.]|nr:AsmA family protein [Pseudolabrys sp.]